MKQIEKTQSITTKLESQGLVPADVVVFEAIALNTRPLRKQSVLYKGAVASRGVLLEMAASLEAETVPLQIMHEGQALPIGRVFEGQVRDTGSESELRVLFAVHASETDHIAKIDTGVIDQVSVSILPKQILNSVSGFDYLGPDATLEQIFTGDDGKGNVLGENGVHAKLIGLDSWNELSLVNKGGAQNARIVARDSSIFSGQQIQRLAASGLDPNRLLLTTTATLENDSVDLTTLVAQLTDTKVELSTATTKVTALEADVAAKTTRIAELEAQVAEAGDAAANLAAKDARIAELSPAVQTLKDVAKTLLVAKGDVNPTIPDDVAALTALISEAKTGLAAVLVAGARSVPADAQETTAKSGLSGAYRSRR
jgi:hypothetical protein